VKELKEKVRSKEIDGDKYTVTPFLGIEGFKVKTKLLSKLAPSIGGALGSIPPGSKSIGDVDVGKVLGPGTLDRLADVLDERELTEFMLRLLKSTTCNDKEITEEFFNLHFAASFHTLWKVLFFVLEVNYGSFFADGGIGQLLVQAATTSTNPSTKNAASS